jgi:uncharacterized radical SAM superfamily Fe-S cluster-containing enzyme
LLNDFVLIESDYMIDFDIHQFQYLINVNIFLSLNDGRIVKYCELNICEEMNEMII